MKAESYSDVLLKPKYSTVPHREIDVDLTSNLAGLKLKLPVISANMKTVTGPPMVQAMYKNGGLGILHRFYTIDDNVKMFLECRQKMRIPFKNIGVSIGVKSEEKKRFQSLYNNGATLFCVDVAHGHHKNVYDMIRYMRNISDDITIIAGNIATPEAAKDLICWGANIVKVGIGPGLACQTRKNTGVGVPQLYAIQSIRNELPNITLIADGGIRTAGCIAKALAAGASAVMCGAVLAGTTETPGRVFPNEDTDLVDRTYYKIYGGSASYENKTNFIEGKIIKVPFKGKVKYILKEIREGLQSCFSLCGSYNLKELQKKAEFISMDIGGKLESET